MKKFHVFDAFRKNKENGVSLLGVHVGLKPVLIQEYSDTFELLVVQISVADKDICVITGYGPQETWTDDERMPFFTALEKEIASAELNGKSVIIAFDANSKLGPEHIPNDPKPQSKNGKVLSGIIKRHALFVVNGLVEKRTGIITRERHTVDGIEKTVIDFVVVSGDLMKHIESIHIDEKRVHVLTKNLKTKSGVEYTESDHNVINTKLNMTWSPKETKVTEVFKYKDKEALKKFKTETTNTTQLSQIVEMDKPLEVVTNKFMKRLKGFRHQCFKKVKIVDKTDKKLEELYNTRRLLRTKEDNNSKIELAKVDKELAEKYSEVMFKKIMTEVKDSNDDEDGGFNAGKLWKLKKKLSPNCSEPPTAMMSDEGKLLTNDAEIVKEAEKHYKNVFKPTEIKEGLKELKETREQLCIKRLEEASKNKTPDWTIEDVTCAIKSLKTGKAQDPYEMPNELFKVAGTDLILAITKLMNRIKNELVFPSALSVCNVTNLFKNNGLKSMLNSYRGISELQYSETY